MIKLSTSLFISMPDSDIYSRRRLLRKLVCAKTFYFIYICVRFKVLQVTDRWKNIQ